MFIVSCTKKANEPVVKTKQNFDKQAETCTFGINAFNKTKRAPSAPPIALKAKPPHTPPTPNSNAVILLDFDGQIISNSIWKRDGSMICTSSNLTTEEIANITKRVSEDFSPFNVVVTSDVTTFNSANPFKRIRVLITESWEWFGLVGGTSFMGSFSWGDDTPCFVFSTLLGYNEKFIAEAASHEIGHTLGLMHQASYSENCTFLSEYNTGLGSGETGWAPIMGIGYYQNVTTWHKGPTLYGCGNIQDDVSTISSVIGLKTDDNNTTHKAEEVTSSVEGIMNSADDIDYYSIDSKGPIKINAAPYCTQNNQGANMHLQLKIYRKNGTLLSSVSNPSSLSANAVVEGGKYYIGVETIAGENQSRYGMLGRYTLRVN